MTDATEARRALAEAKLSRHISEAVAAAPPLTPEQRAHLAVLLTAGTTPKDAAGSAPKDAGEVARARADVAEAKLRRAVEEALATFPPLSEEVKADIAHLLANG